jgi:hypothetical protein
MDGEEIEDPTAIGDSRDLGEDEVDSVASIGASSWNGFRLIRIPWALGGDLI